MIWRFRLEAEVVVMVRVSPLYPTPKANLRVMKVPFLIV